MNYAALAMLLLVVFFVMAHATTPEHSDTNQVQR